jgi:hypothetical protein
MRLRQVFQVGTLGTFNLTWNIDHECSFCSLFGLVNGKRRSARLQVGSMGPDYFENFSNQCERYRSLNFTLSHVIMEQTCNVNA